MLRSRYLGAGRLSVVDEYYKSSYQKTIIIIIFPTRPTAWSPLSVHQAINPSIVPFYNSKGFFTELCRELLKGNGKNGLSWVSTRVRTLFNPFLLLIFTLMFLFCAGGTSGTWVAFCTVLVSPFSWCKLIPRFSAVAIEALEERFLFHGGRGE